MHPNPFCPSFSLRPELFYGRKEYLTDFERAISNDLSPDASLILTGTRGCGKTSLLHQYAIAARKVGMTVVESTGTDAVAKLLDFAQPHRGVQISKSLNPSVSIGGIGSVSAFEYRATDMQNAPGDDGMSLLSKRLCEQLQRRKYGNGLLVTIDEVQKVAEDDIVAIGNAVQDAVTQGSRACLALGGLPNAYHRLRNFKRCTFLRRMRRVKLWCMDVEETLGFVGGMFARVPEMGLTDDQLFSIAEFTGGHPYLVQLVGHGLYQLVERHLAPISGTVVPVPEEIIAEAQNRALSLYKQNVLDDVLGTTRRKTREYIYQAFVERREDGLIRVRDVNSHFPQKTPAQLNSIRDYALNTQVLQFERYGYLSFALPHCRYIFQNLEYEERPEPRSRRWQY